MSKPMTVDDAIRCYKNQTPITIRRIGKAESMKFGYIVEMPRRDQTEMMMDSSGCIIKHQMVTVEGMVYKYKKECLGKRRYTVALSAIREWGNED